MYYTLNDDNIYENYIILYLYDLIDNYIDLSLHYCLSKC
jgi:hypothetical protein